MVFVVGGGGRGGAGYVAPDEPVRGGDVGQGEPVGGVEAGEGFRQSAGFGAEEGRGLGVAVEEEDAEGLGGGGRCGGDGV